LILNLLQLISARWKSISFMKIRRRERYDSKFDQPKRFHQGRGVATIGIPEGYAPQATASATQVIADAAADPTAGVVVFLPY
jgi:hypothetical protein